MKWKLEIVNDAQNEIVYLSGKTITMGREGGVRIQDPSCSRLHAEVQIDEQGRIHLTDLASSNGTFVGSQRITGTTLKADQSIRIGKTSIRILPHGESLVVHTWPQLLECRPAGE